MKTILVCLLLFCNFGLRAQFSIPTELTHQLSNLNMVETGDMDGDGDADIVATGTYGNNIVWFENLGAGNFSLLQLISNDALNASAIQLADLDGDGDLDLVVARSSGPTIDPDVITIENFGSGNFSTPTALATSLVSVRSILVVDFDEDGDNDILAAEYTSTGDIVWFENDATGSFSASQLFSDIAYTYCSLAVGDIDADGDMDILAGADGTANKLIKFTNLGGGNYASSVNAATLLDGIKSTRLYDLDNDGDLDILSSLSSTNQICWNPNNGSGVFSSKIVLSSAVSGASFAVASDFDLDGDLDVTASSLNGDKIVRFENLGSGTFGPEIIVSTLTQTATSVASTDLNGDGLPEILSTSSYDDRLAWFENLGSNIFGSVQNICDTTGHANRPESVELADMDNDGFSDALFCAEYDALVGWFENTGNNTFSETRHIVYYDLLQPARYACAADLDNDSDQDVICALYEDDQVIWLENLGGGVFGLPQQITTLTNGVLFIYPADIDYDGDTDLFSVSAFDDEIAWYQNDGLGNFGAQIIIPSSCNLPWHLDYGDLDQDGLNDLLAVSSDNKTFWFKNLGAGTFGSQQLISSTSANPYKTDIADLNNDGMNDVIVASNSDGDLSWYQNLGAGIFSTENVIDDQVSGQLFCLASDLDLDGDMDVLGARENTDLFYWVENMGSGSFATPTIISSTHAGPTWLAVQDTDGDGDQDFICSSYNDDRISVFTNDVISDKQLTGKIFYDVNNNGIYDGTDFGINYVPIETSPTNSYSFSFVGGEYFIIPDTFGVYTVYPQLISDWYITTDSLSYTVDVNIASPLIDSLDFGVHCDSIYYILEADLLSASHPCNQVINYYINVLNIGTMVGVGVMQLNLDDSLTFISSSFTPDSIVDQTIYWKLDSLNILNSISFSVQIETPGVSSLGYWMNSYFELISFDTLGNPVNNYTDSIYATIACAYDPNKKIVQPAGYTEYGYIPDSTKELTYTVFFQNTGTDTAQNVLIEDQLESMLNWTGIQILGSSHFVQASLDPSGMLSFYFPSIMLPDSNVNQAGSNGYVIFKIEIDSATSAGSEIGNAVSIYFDLNPPINTDTAIVTLYNCTLENQISIASAFCNENGIEVGAISPILQPSLYEWQLQGLDTLSNQNMIWNFENTGLQNLQLSLSNPICSFDSLFTFMVYSPDTINLPAIEICDYDSTFIFTNYFSTAGIYQNVYQNQNGCDSVVYVELIVNDAPLVSNVSPGNDTLCIYENTLTLVSNPLGGSYMGNGISGDNFNPTMAGAGVHTIIYQYTNSDGCSNADTIQITIDNCLSLDENSIPSISIYPNPFSNKITLANSTLVAGNYTVRIFDLKGNIIYIETWNSESILEIKTEQWPAGYYYGSLSKPETAIPVAVVPLLKE